MINVFIIGTNCTGKSSLARELLQRRNGIDFETKFCCYSKDKITAFAGNYTSPSNTNCGVDHFGQTKCLVDCVKEAKNKNYKVFFAEGSKIGTFGVNIVQSLFESEKQLVVALYAPLSVIKERLYARSKTEITKWQSSNLKTIFRTVKKYKNIGVPVMMFDTSKIDIKNLADEIEEYITLELKNEN